MSIYSCGVQTPRMKGPCVLWKRHTEFGPVSSRRHRSISIENQDTPTLREWRRILEVGLDNGVQLSALEVAQLSGRTNLHSVVGYGLGSRFTKLRRSIFAERGVTNDNHRRSAAASHKIVEDMRSVL